MVLLWDWLLLRDLQIHHRWTQTQRSWLTLCWQRTVPSEPRSQCALLPLLPAQSRGGARRWASQRHEVQDKEGSPHFTTLDRIIPKAIWGAMPVNKELSKKKKCLLTWFSLIHVDVYIGEKKNNFHFIIYNKNKDVKKLMMIYY